MMFSFRMKIRLVIPQLEGSLDSLWKILKDLTLSCLRIDGAFPSPIE